MIAFDIDDTTFDSFPVFRTYFMSRFGYDLYPRLEHNQCVPGFNEDEVRDHVEFVLMNYNEIFLPCKNAIAALFKFYNLTKKPIIFITARRKIIRNATIELLDTKLPSTIPYTLIHSRSSKKKDVVQELGLDYFVDDRMSIIESCRNVCKMAFLVNRTWNMNKKTTLDITRVNNLMEVFDYVRRNL